MSVRRLTNVQAARRVLRERRYLCENRSPLSQVSARFALPGNDYPTQFTEKQIATFIRQVRRSKKGWGRALRYDPEGLMYDVLTAHVPNADERSVRLWAHRVTPGALLQLPHPDRSNAKTKIQIRRYFNTNVSRTRAIDFGPCGPCSADELVAIDTLLETGDRYAERLAKQCKKGGGILEGSLKRRKRRR